MKRIQRIIDWIGNAIFIDWILEIITLLVIIYGIWTSMHYFNQLPDNMPSHWGLDGRVDQFSKKNYFGHAGIPTIILYLIFSIVIIVNSAKAKIDRQVFLSLRCVRIIRLSIVYLFLQFDYNAIMDTLKQPHNYSGYLFWVSILLIVGTLAYMIFYSLVKMKHS